jgi:hypothetical protein
MEISPNLIIRPSSLQDASPAALKSWQVGQVLSATVAGVSTNGTVTLRINNVLLNAQTSLALQTGQALKLEVTRAGEQPLLKVALPPAPQDVQAQALRSALPRQRPLAPLLANLGNLAARLQNTNDPAGKELAQLARQVIDNLAGKGDVSHGAGLKQALQNSGIFLESRLAASLGGGPPLSAGDLKAGLLRLLAVLQTQAGGGGGERVAPDTAAGHDAARGTPPPAVPPPMRSALPQAQASASATLTGSTLSTATSEILHQTEGALARLQLNQIASLPNEQQPQRLWALELPVQHEQRTDLFQLRIEEETTGNRRDSTTPWSVMLAFDLPSLGPVHARLLLNGTQVSATLWAERPGTAALFNAQLEELRAGLQRAGVLVGRVTCTEGTPAMPSPPPGYTPLVDTHA